MMNRAIALKNQVLKGYKVTKEDVMGLVEEDTQLLSECANDIRIHFNGHEFDMCSIINGKSGKCSENCKYCAQSGHYQTAVQCYPMLSKEACLQVAEENWREGVDRYSVVTSGGRLSEHEMEQVTDIYKYIHEQCDIKLCASHGLLNDEDFLKLKEVGVIRYHNNLETSRNYFPSVCTTHTYDDKVRTLMEAKRAGLEICSGGLFGMGETMEDRIDMALDLRELGVDSIPINILVPIEGTPFGSLPSITEDEALKIMAMYRYIHPSIVLRLAGGRDKLLHGGEKAFLGGINGTISGNLLTTCGNTIKEDKELIQRCGFKVTRS